MRRSSETRRGEMEGRGDGGGVRARVVVRGLVRAAMLEKNLQRHQPLIKNSCLWPGSDEGALS